MRRGLAAALGALSLAVCAGGGAAGAVCEMGVMADLPVTMLNGRPLVPAKVNGREVSFVIDSGAFFSLITPASAAELKLPTTAAPVGYFISGVNGDAGVELTRVRRFDLSKTSLSNLQFIVGGSEVGAGASGLIGQNVLGVADVEYDLADGAVRLIRPHDCGRGALAYWRGDKPYGAIPIESLGLAGRRTIGEVLVNGHRLRATFDTGAPATVMTVRAAAAAGIKLDAPEIAAVGYGGGIGRRTTRTWIAPVASFQIGDETVKNTKMFISDFDLDNADILIGDDFFLSHRLYVANSRGKLYFTYNGGPVFDLSRLPSAPAGATQDLKTASAASGPPAASPLEPPATAAAPPVSKADVNAPLDADGFERRGAALAARQDNAAAVADFTRAIDLAPREPRYLYQRALARLALNQVALATDDLGAALALKPDYADARVARAAVHLRDGDTADARADVASAAAAVDTRSNARLTLAGLYEQLEDFPDAVSQYDLWIAAHPDDFRRWIALNGRCWARAQWGQELEQALSDCNAALRSMPKMADVLDSRGLVRLRRGEYGRALADYDAALALKPKIVWSLYGRGLAELKTGATAKGDADLGAATALDPRQVERAKALGLTREAYASGAEVSAAR